MHARVSTGDEPANPGNSDAAVKAGQVDIEDYIARRRAQEKIAVERFGEEIRRACEAQIRRLWP